jgi:hypothetical protein
MIVRNQNKKEEKSYSGVEAFISIGGGLLERRLLESTLKRWVSGALAT